MDMKTICEIDNRTFPRYLAWILSSQLWDDIQGEAFDEPISSNTYFEIRKVFSSESSFGIEMRTIGERIDEQIKMDAIKRLSENNP